MAPGQQYGRVRLMSDLPSSSVSPLGRAADKAGLLGVVITAAGCANCFPALASLGAAVGLGFLNHYEGLLIRILLPLFAGLALLANGWGARQHRRGARTVLGLLGPLLVLAAVYVMRATHHRTGWLLYPGLALMIGVSIWDLLSPPRCAERTGPATVPHAG
jgi:mercuric ion transport protein